MLIVLLGVSGPVLFGIGLHSFGAPTILAIDAVIIAVAGFVSAHLLKRAEE